MLVCASRGFNCVANSSLVASEAGNKAAPWPESRRRCTGWGWVAAFTDRDSRQEKRRDSRNHTEGEGRPKQPQMERATARTDKEGDPGVTDGEGRRGRQRWGDSDLCAQLIITI